MPSISLSGNYKKFMISLPTKTVMQVESASTGAVRSMSARIVSMIGFLLVSFFMISDTARATC